MTQRVPKNRSKVEKVTKNDWDNFIELKLRDELPKRYQEMSLDEFERYTGKMIKYGGERLNNRCRVDKCAVGRTKPGVLGLMMDIDPAVCFIFEISHPSRGGRLRICSGPLFVTERRDWKWQKKNHLGHELPERGCPTNLFELEDVDRDDAISMVFDELVEKHPDYEEVEIDE